MRPLSRNPLGPDCATLWLASLWSPALGTAWRPNLTPVTLSYYERLATLKLHCAGFCLCSAQDRTILLCGKNLFERLKPWWEFLPRAVLSEPPVSPQKPTLHNRLCVPPPPLQSGVNIDKWCDCPTTSVIVKLQHIALRMSSSRVFILFFCHVFIERCNRKQSKWLNRKPPAVDTLSVCVALTNCCVDEGGELQLFCFSDIQLHWRLMQTFKGWAFKASGSFFGGSPRCLLRY